MTERSKASTPTAERNDVEPGHADDRHQPVAAPTAAASLQPTNGAPVQARALRTLARDHAAHAALRHPPSSCGQVHASPLAHRLGRLAVSALHAELACAPKPGLVTPFDSGSHTDMDASTFLRSLFALRGYFVAIAQAGIDNAPFARLRDLGIAAEAAMLRATGGINTHRGAIFSLGLLTAQAARLRAAHARAPAADAVCQGVQLWREALLAAPLDPRSNGQRMRAQHKVSGVREQAAMGYPLLHQVALPALRTRLATGATREAALAHTLMQLVAQVDDLNLLHRGGAKGLAYAKAQAQRFLADGGTAQPNWRDQLAAIGNGFVQRRLSPGGSADLLACAWFVHCQEHA
ncbi:triphosphoribosyl-dephospho-CoA synthase MdcB [Xanthomonas codiaei]|uniref:Probable 2-(5''-triphosphoribosyl)-3'-dephosphocoenzyme-A synthase n=1 Tax=Xanthomonas codiaei TaxID=56463 RepID=A0ABW9MMU9_9XANT